MFRSWIVLGFADIGRIEEATALNAAILEHCRRIGDRYMEPESLRPAGELALAGGNLRSGAAERLFHEAITIAQAHGARCWELCAAMSLAALLQNCGQRKEATACLELVLVSFADGLSTVDLVDVTVFLTSLD
ncbi:MAG: hypothetical protein OEN23_09640 [Paracoccaceae bacterium]|nr:hypothetical protein [Paracoccaceae bacterium]